MIRLCLRGMAILEKVDDNTNKYLYVVENYHKICYNVGEYKSKYRFENDRIEIMAVTKTVAPEIVNVAIGAGIGLIGENKVQEYMSKKGSYDKSAQVHFIGHLQTNKVKQIINDVSVIESVDNLKLACEIDRQAKKNGHDMDIFIEVNVGNEISKSGIDIKSLDEFVYQVAELQNIHIKGLMAIPPINADEKHYAVLQEAFMRLKDKKIKNASMETLSVGMSGDYEVAIKYGSNIVRIGTGLFGKRKYMEV